MNPNAYDVFLCMKANYQSNRKVLSTEDLVLMALFSGLGAKEIMKGEQMFQDWLFDMKA